MKHRQNYDETQAKAMAERRQHNDETQAKQWLNVDKTMMKHKQNKMKHGSNNDDTLVKQ